MRTTFCKHFSTPPYIKLHKNDLHFFPYNNLMEPQKDQRQIIGQGVSGVEKTDLFPNARQLFDELPQRDVVSVTTLITGLARNHRHKEAVYVFSKMLELDIRPNEYTFATLIHSSTAVKDLSTGKQLHGYAMRMNLQSNVFVGSAVLDLYAKLSTVEEAQMSFEDMSNPNVVSYTSLVYGYLKKDRLDDALKIFKRMPERNVVSWNAMIAGYSQKGHNEEAVNLYVEMLREGFLPTESTFPCVISSAGNIAALGMVKSFHASAFKSLGKFDVFVCNSLISFYAKCGSLEDSLLVFNKLPERDIVSWNALICGYAQNGRGKEALDIFRDMESTGLRPNSFTLLGVLLACNHVGLVDEGYFYFDQSRVQDPSLLKPEHYACMVDLLSRSGRFSEAERFISDLPFNPGTGFWKALLGGCQIHSNMELGEFAAKKILDLDPEDVSSYVMLSNAHSAAGRWQSVLRIRHEMREKGMKRVPGCSWIEIKSMIHVFVNGDRRHDRKTEIYTTLRLLIDHLAVSTQDSSILDSTF